jgi:hypothetical protein
MLFFNIFYQKYGIRKSSQLMVPPLPKLELLQLPKDSIVHFVTTSPLEAGPASDNFLFNGITRPIMMDHIVTVGSTEGNPRLTPVPAATQIRHYHTQNRRFKLMRSLEASGRDPSTLIVYNYGIIPRLYRYMRSLYSEYYKWINIQSAVWKNINAVTAVSARQHFIVCKLPQLLPSVGQFKVGSNITMESIDQMVALESSNEGLTPAMEAISQRIVSIFNTPESLMLLEIWLWLGTERHKSVISNVAEAQLNKVNLIFQESGCWFVLNLGTLNSWRKATKEELALNPEANVKGIDAAELQKRFVRLTMAVTELRSKPTVDSSNKKDSGGVVIKPTSGTPTFNASTGSVTTGTKEVNTPDVTDPDDTHSNGTDTNPDNLHKELDDIEQIDLDLAELDDIAERKVVQVLNKADLEPVLHSVHGNTTLDDGVMRVCDKLADKGMLSAAEYRRYSGLAASYKTMIAPDGKSTMEEYIKIPPEALLITESATIPDIKTVLDKSMLKSSLIDFDTRYIKDVLNKDIAGMVLNIQNAGIAVTGYDVENIDTVLGAYAIHTVKINPVEGAASTVRFKLPILDEDGSYVANGVKYNMRKQRGDVPIRKIAPDKVALTSYYGKRFVTRSAKRVNDYGQWIRNAVMAKSLDPDDKIIDSAHPANVFDNQFSCPRLFSILAMGFRSIKVKGFDLYLDHTKRHENYTKPTLDMYEVNGSVVIGVLGGIKSLSTNTTFLIVDKHDALYTGLGGVLTVLGSIEDFLELDHTKAPIEYSELNVMGQSIPVGIILGYEMGLEKLTELLGITPRRVPAGTRVVLAEDEYDLVFSDETLIFSRDDKLASMVLGGFMDFHKIIRTFSVYEFDKPAVYLNVLETVGNGARYLREIDLLYQLFIDPITRDLLIEMKEPIDFRGLLLRSCDLLLTDKHPDELDPKYQRIKGYERLAGAVYSEVVKSIRIHNGRSGKNRLPIDVNPYAVWKNIMSDPSGAQVSDINPIQNLKEMEAVTFSGTGGRNSRSMTKKTRLYHENDMGTISESTVDSSDVAVNTYLSADPQFTSLRGMSRRYKVGETGVTALLSTSALLAPGSDRDDPKRVNFIAIQNSHAISCDSYSQSPVRTGYDQVIAHRTSDMFAMTAKKPGVVTAVTDEGIVLTYDDGEVKGVEIGRRFGSAAGLTIPHTLVADVKVGQRFKPGTLISHNTGFFEKDTLNPNTVALKTGIMVRTALIESAATLEDSSAISPKVASLLSSKMTKVKDVIVSFDQSVRKLVKVGDNLESEDILCIIEDAITANSNLFDEESLDTLKVLSSQTPQAKIKGKVERIEVFYHGDKEDMSESIRSIVNVSDRAMASRSNSVGKKKVYTGSVDEGFRVDGNSLALDTVAIKIYITGDVAAGIGDKGVFCNQMKTVFGKVLPGEVTTESGLTVDAIFGYQSIAARIVTSPETIGTTATLLDVIAQKAIKAYRS